MTLPQHSFIRFSPNSTRMGAVLFSTTQTVNAYQTKTAPPTLREDAAVKVGKTCIIPEPPFGQKNQ